MKTLLIIFIGLSWELAYSQSTLEVVVTKVKDATGNVRVGLFKDEETFLEKAIYGEIVKAQKDQVTVVFKNIPPGTYGVSVIHDENENGELDSGTFGIPKEGFGFGNDAMGTFGPPGFKKASITVEPGKRSISIGMRYL